METTASVWTEEELVSLPRDGFKRELIEGELIKSPAGFDHERIGARLLSRLMIHADAHALGVVCGSSLGCWMANEDLLCPDVSFISRARLASTRLAPGKFFRGAPDLVVEIMSPFDTIGKVRKKMEDYFTSGTRLAWVLNPGEKLRSSTVLPPPTASSARPPSSMARMCFPASASPSRSCSPIFRSIE